MKRNLDDDLRELTALNRGNAVLRVLFLVAMPHAMYVGAWIGTVGLVVSFLYLHAIAAETRQTIQILHDLKEKRTRNALFD